MNYESLKTISVTIKELDHKEPIHGLSEVTFTIRARTTLDAQRCATLLDRMVDHLKKSEA